MKLRDQREKRLDSAMESWSRIDHVSPFHVANDIPIIRNLDESKIPDNHISLILGHMGNENLL